MQLDPEDRYSEKAWVTRRPTLACARIISVLSWCWLYGLVTQVQAEISSFLSPMRSPSGFFGHFVFVWLSFVRGLIMEPSFFLSLDPRISHHSTRSGHRKLACWSGKGLFFFFAKAATFRDHTDKTTSIHFHFNHRRPRLNPNWIPSKVEKQFLMRNTGGDSVSPG